MTMMPKKTMTLSELTRTIAGLRREGKRVVHTHGVFEELHPVYIEQLKAARAEGDALVVTISSDSSSSPGREEFSITQRAECVAALGAVDLVAISGGEQSADLIRLLQPDVYVRTLNRSGSAPAAGGSEDEEAIRELGGRFHRLDDGKPVNRNGQNSFLTVFPPETRERLHNFKSHYTSDEVIRSIASFGDLNVLVVGEAILDEYVYGVAIGKSSKEPIVALQYQSSEMHAGGSVSIANHLASFSRSVTLVTYIGDESPHEDFIREGLHEKVRPVLIRKANSPTIVKTRYVESYQATKLVEMYRMNDDPMSGGDEQAFCTALEEELAVADVVISADYGHGLVTDRAVDLLCSSARNLAVNTQINAGNHGYHTLSRYPSAFYVCVHEGEVRLDQRDRTRELRDLVVKLAGRMKTKKVMVTRGNKGTLFYDSEAGFNEFPALSVKIVDRVGAGDAVLAITSLGAAHDLPPDMIGFIANMVGAQAVMILGNRSAINREQLISDIETILR